MTMTRMQLCLVPSVWWNGNVDNVVWNRALSELEGIQRRLRKGVDPKVNGAAYRRCCRLLEEEIRKAVQICKDIETAKTACAQGTVAAVAVDPEGYFRAIGSGLEGEDMKLGATIHSPEHIAGHIKMLEKLVTQDSSPGSGLGQFREVFESATTTRAGVVELQSPWSGGRSVAPTLRSVGVRSNLPSVCSFNDGESEAISFDYKIMEQLLDLQLRQALVEPVAVNFSNIRHQVATGVLQRYVFTGDQPAGPSKDVRVVYRDGSEGDPFPLACLPADPSRAAKASNHPAPLKTGLISMRHLDLDREVRWYWFRNSVVSQARRLAESDRLCYEETSRQLAEALADPDIPELVLHLYHTGLEPAVLGFYRALVKAIPDWRQKEKFLAIIPMFLSGQAYKAGKPWC